MKDITKSIDMDAIIAEVKANRALLESCSGHDFSIAIDRITKVPLTEVKTFCDWKCSKCGGHVDGMMKIWYNKGVAHEQARVAAAMA